MFLTLAFTFFFPRNVLISREASLHSASRLLLTQIWIVLFYFLYQIRSGGEALHFLEGLGIREDKAISHYKRS